jgi:hypothetical protein
MDTLTHGQLCFNAKPTSAKNTQYKISQKIDNENRKLFWKNKPTLNF